MRIFSLRRRLHARHRPVPGWHRPLGLRPQAGTQTGRPAETGPAGCRLRASQAQQLGGQVQDAQQERNAAACAGEQQLHHREGTRPKKEIIKYTANIICSSLSEQTVAIRRQKPLEKGGGKNIFCHGSYGKFINTLSHSIVLSRKMS